VMGCPVFQGFNLKDQGVANDNTPLPGRKSSLG
jgi:hypothetical protein